MTTWNKTTALTTTSKDGRFCIRKCYPSETYEVKKDGEWVCSERWIKRSFRTLRDAKVYCEGC